MAQVTAERIARNPVLESCWIGTSVPTRHTRLPPTRAIFGANNVRISGYVKIHCLLGASTESTRRYLHICAPIGTCVPDRHTVCRSYSLIYQADKARTAHFVTQEYVPICADAGVAIDRAAASIP